MHLCVKYFLCLKSLFLHSGPKILCETWLLKRSWMMVKKDYTLRCSPSYVTSAFEKGANMQTGLRENRQGSLFENHYERYAILIV